MRFKGGEKIAEVTGADRAAVEVSTNLFTTYPPSPSSSPGNFERSNIIYSFIIRHWYPKLQRTTILKQKREKK